MSKNLLRFLHEILTALIEESPTLPDGVLDCLLSQIETYAEVSSLIKTLHEAHVYRNVG